MSVDDRQCNECGSSSWTKLLETGYPENRKDRDQTVREVYECESCGAEGRRFDQRNDGTEKYSGAMR